MGLFTSKGGGEIGCGEAGSTNSGGFEDEGRPRAKQDVRRRIGDYELLDEIARGGMGVVYRARQVSLDRMVAVKVLLASHFVDDTFIKRFRREAEAAASLNHPNIVAIHEVGEHDGQPFFSMELVEGRNLAELTREKPLPAREAAQLVKTIAQAVQFAHERGLLHRDLKPSNVVVDSFNAPHITDFGLAKRTEDADLTLTGQILGTPNYMPPEQADPKRGPTTPASDVYSLGAILYQLLTGRAPFMAETLTQTLRLVTDTEAVSPRLLSPSVPRDLETICSKCLEKDAKRRYASAHEFAEELARFLNDEPIRARPITMPARLMSWCRRKPALVGSFSLILILILIVIVGSPIAIVRINGAREAAEEAREQAETSQKKEAVLRLRAEAAERATERQLYTALLEQARARMVSGEMGHRVQALDALRRAAAISNSAELRREVMTALMLPDLRFNRELSLAPDVTFAVPDPSFERHALGRGREPIEIRAVSDNRLLATLPASTNLPAFYKQWSADGRFLAVKRDYPDGGRHADWEIWDLAAEKRVLLLQNVAFSALSFHPRLPRVIARNREGTAIWNLEDGRELVRIPLSIRPVILAFSPDGKRFAAFSPGRQSLDGGGLLTVHDATNPGAAELASRTFNDDVSIVGWHPDGRSLVVPDHGGVVHWVDAHTGESEILGRHKSRGARAVFSPNGAYLFTGAWGGELICWDARTKRRAFTASLNNDHIQFSADGRRCAVLAQTSVRLLAFEQRSAHRELAEDLGVQLTRATISPDGRWLAASGDKRAGIWDLSGVGAGTLDNNAYETDFYFTPDGQELFGSRNEGTSACFRWRLTPATNAAAPPVLSRLPLHTPKGLTTLSLVSNSVVMTSAEGSQILAPGESDPDSGRWVPTSSGINGVSPDGRWLGIRRHNGASLYVYRLPQLEEVATLTHPLPFGDFRFSPRGDEVAIASIRAGSLATFWNTTTWEQTRALTNFSRVLYTPDARTLWFYRDRRNAGLYDACTLEPLLLLPTGMLPLALSPDGQRVAVSVDAQRLQLWDLPTLREEFRVLGLDWGDRSEFTQARRLGESTERQTEEQLYSTLLEQARATVLTGGLGQRVRALDVAGRAAAISNSAALRGVAMSALALPDLRFQRELPVPSNLTLASLDPAFERIALSHAHGPVEIRSVSDHQLIARLPATTRRSVFTHGIWSPDGRFLAVRRDYDARGVQNTIEVWELALGKRVLLLRDLPNTLSFHPRLPRIIVGGVPAEVGIWDLETGQQLVTHPLEAPPNHLKFAPNGERFASTQRSPKGTLFAIHDTAIGTTLVSRLLPNHVSRFEWHPSGRWVAGGDSKGAVHLIDARTGEMRTLGWHRDDVRTVVFSPDGRYLFSGGWDRQLICWDLNAMRQALTIGLESYLMQVRADGRQCAIVRWPQIRIQLHSFEIPTLCRQFAEDLGGDQNHAVFSADGRWLAASGAGERVVVWDMTTEGPGASLTKSTEAQMSFAANGELFSNDGRNGSRWRVHPGTNGSAPTLERLDLATPREFSHLCLLSNAVVFTGARGSKVVGFDQLANDQGTWKPTADGPNAVSLDGRWLAVRRPPGSHLYVYRLPGIEPMAKLINEAPITRFEFSPLSSEVAACSPAGVEFWSTSTWRRTRHLTNFTQILYSSDARTFWLTTPMRVAGLYDARTVELLLPLPPNTIPLALSPNDRHLAVSVDSRHVQVWDLSEMRRQLSAIGFDRGSDHSEVRTSRH